MLRNNRIFVWSGRRDSNSRHPAWKAEALPTELLPLTHLCRLSHTCSKWRNCGIRDCQKRRAYPNAFLGNPPQRTELQIGRLNLFPQEKSNSCRKSCSSNRSLKLNRNLLQTTQLRLVVGGGFEPPKASPTDLQSVPFDHSGTPPRIITF